MKILAVSDRVLDKLYSGQTVIAENDTWQVGNCATEASENRKPKDPREACLAITLDPGSYTTIVSGAGGTTGVALVEVFAANDQPGPDLNPPGLRGGGLTLESRVRRYLNLGH